MLIVIQRQPLEQMYATSGYQQIRSALAALESPRDKVLALDDPEELRSWGLNVASSPDQIKSAIRTLAVQIPSVVDSVLLVGGGPVVPFFSFQNPVTDRNVDPDPVVLTDNPYGSAADVLEEYLAPSLPVGRLAVRDSAAIGEFLSAVQSIVDHPPKAGRDGSAIFVNDDWIGYSQRVATALPGPQTWHVSPGYVADSSSEDDAGFQTLYFNLHGFSGDSDWKGYSTIQKQFVSAVSPGLIDPGFVAGALAFAECCYSAQIAGRSAQNSCALKFVQAGASFIGATGLAFGSYIASDFLLEDADFLVRAFFQAIASGASIGTALMVSRKAYLLDSSEARQGQAWQCKQKTLLQFVLYGNPTLIH